MTARPLARRALAASLLFLAAGCSGTDAAVAQDRERVEPQQQAQQQVPEVPAVVDTLSAMNLSNTFRAAAARALPGVVTVQVEIQPQARQRERQPDPFFFPFPFDRPEQQPGPRTGQGSGFMFTEEGHVITNHHVVANASSVQVRFPDGRVYDGVEIVGQDRNTDLAVLKLEPRNNERFHALPMGDSDRLQVGDWVLALGNPLDLGFTVTAGIVSATARQLHIIEGDIALESFIQTDAVINRGNSGGPLVDLLGRVVGVNTAIVSPTGAYAGNGFAIPSALVEKAARDMIEHGYVRRPMIGVEVTAVTEAQAELYGLDRIAGAVVAAVTEGAPADRAGIRAEDVVIAVDGNPVNSPPELTARLARYQPGERVTLTIVRDGRSRDIQVRLGEFEQAQPTAQPAQPRETAQQRLGFSATDVTPQVASQLGIEEGTQGVVVTSIRQPGPAQGVLARGMVILEVNRQRVRNVQELERMAQDIERGEVVVLQVLNPQTGSVGVRSYRVR